MLLPLAGKRRETWGLLPFKEGGCSLLPGRRRVLMELKTVLSSMVWGCSLCSFCLGESQMLSEPLWRALVKALSVFSSFFPPVSKLKPSLGSKDMCEMLTLCCKNIVMHPSARMMLKIKKLQQAAQYLQVTCCNFPSHVSVGALSQNTQPMLWQQP